MKICIIKLGAKGDVIRTIPIAKAIKDKYLDAEITWITKPNIQDILQTYEFINKITTSKPEESFDILYNFDIDDQATNLSQSIQAIKKLGFYNQDNFVQAYNLGAEYYLNTLFDDEIKKSNTKTYQQMMFEVAELQPTNENPKLNLPQQALDYANNFLKENNLSTEKLIGIHIGASPRWPSKSPHQETLKELITKLKQQEYKVLLFGGPNEIEKLKPIAEELNIPTNNPTNTNLEFASMINKCKAIICPDSFSLHISLALKKPTIGLFFCTSPNEVESYNLLTKLISPLLKQFFPEKMDQYDEELVKSITADEILSKIKKRLDS